MSCQHGRSQHDLTRDASSKNVADATQGCVPSPSPFKNNRAPKTSLPAIVYEVRHKDQSRCSAPRDGESILAPPTEELTCSKSSAYPKATPSLRYQMLDHAHRITPQFESSEMLSCDGQISRLPMVRPRSSSRWASGIDISLLGSMCCGECIGIARTRRRHVVSLHVVGIWRGQNAGSGSSRSFRFTNPDSLDFLANWQRVWVLTCISRG
jgi:hypothetical protein